MKPLFWMRFRRVNRRERWHSSRGRRLLQNRRALIQRALGVVVGLQGLAIFVGCALALSGYVENLPS